MTVASASTSTASASSTCSGRIVDDGVHGVEPQSVDVVVAHPHERVVDHEAPHLVAARAVEVQRRAPVRAVTLREVWPELGEVVPCRPEVVVHDVEHHAETARVARIDEAFQAFWPAVLVMRRVQVDAVVTPAALAGELDHRHQLDRVDAERDEVVEMIDRRRRRCRRA